MRSSSVLLLCLSLLLMSEAHAAAIPLPKKPPVSIPKIPKGGLYGVAAQVAATKALEALDWVMTDGAKVKRKTAPADTNTTDTNAGTQTSSGELSPNASYPLEYISWDSKAFASAQAAHKQNIEAYMKAHNLIRSRNEEGLFYDKLDVYIGNRGYYGSGVGYFVSSVQLASAKNPPKNLIGGSLYQISGQIFYKGSESLENIQVSGDYKAKREAARKAVADAIAQALPADDDIEDQPLPGEVDLPDTKSRPKAPVVPIPHDEPANDPEYNPQEKDKEKKKDKPKPVPATRPEKDPKTNPQTQPRPSTRPDKPKDNPKTTPDTKPDEESKPEHDPNADPTQNPHTDPKSDPKPNAQPKPSPNAQPKPTPSTRPEKDPQTNPDTKPDDEPKPTPATRPEKDQGKAPAFELPAFCDWAKPVCDFVEWMKKEPQDIKNEEVPEIKDDKEWQSYAERNWVNFGNAKCPDDIRIPVTWMNTTQDIVISYVPFCRFAVMIRPAVILGAYISALMIISIGRQRE